MLGSDLIKSMGGKLFPVRRSRGGSYVKGVWVEDESGPAELQILMSEQPLTGKDVAQFPEGDRNRERKKVYAAKELRPRLEATGAKADEITIRGIIYEVEKVETWTGYWKCVIVRKDTAEEAV